LTCTRTEVQLVPLGGERVVGKIDRGQITWQPDENPNASYLIVTEGLVYKFAAALAKNLQLRQEIKILRAQLEEIR
jgi:hypothetical protein